jgi:hypothetical protein
VDDRKVTEAEEKLGRALTEQEKADIQAGAIVVGDQIVLSSEGKAEGARK